MKSTGHTASTPCWVDLSAADLPAAASFYGQLFGWRTRTAPGGYTFFLLDDRVVAAAMLPSATVSAWKLYVSVSDAAATAAAAALAGGTVLAPPAPVGGQGISAVLADPGGAEFGVWQATGFTGADLVGAPTSYTWAELATRDPEPAKEFYPRVFGWAQETYDYGDSRYTEWSVDGRPLGGMIPLGPGQPAGIPAHWMVYFAVTDADAVAARAVELGATVFVQPMSNDVGRFACLADPQGATFAVIARKTVSILGL